MAGPMSREPPRRLIFPAGGGRRGAFPAMCSRDTVIRTILFFAGFLLIIFLCSEEFARALEWLRACLQRSPRSRIIVYPLVLLLIAAAGFIIFTSLLKFSTSLTFSYD
jgi:predicted PurR-regulated permease PerM